MSASHDTAARARGKGGFTACRASPVESRKAARDARSRSPFVYTLKTSPNDRLAQVFSAWTPSHRRTPSALCSIAANFTPGSTLAAPFQPPGAEVQPARWYSIAAVKKGGKPDALPRWQTGRLLQCADRLKHAEYRLRAGREPAFRVQRIPRRPLLRFHPLRASLERAGGLRSGCPQVGATPRLNIRVASCLERDNHSAGATIEPNGVSGLNQRIPATRLA
jgi:hypothetical protein